MIRALVVAEVELHRDADVADPAAAVTKLLTRSPSRSVRLVTTHVAIGQDADEVLRAIARTP